MKYDALQQLLKKLPVPPLDESAKERAIERARLAFLASEESSKEPESARRRLPLFAGLVSGVAALIALMLFIVLPEKSAFNPDSQALAITLRRDGEVIRLVGQSGRKISVVLDGQSITLEPLLTIRGEVIVEGDDFLWHPGHPARLNGYEIQARPI